MNLVGRKKRNRRPKKLIGNHQRCWIWGQHAVFETLRGARWLPIEIAFDATRLDSSSIDELRQRASHFAIPIVSEGSESLTTKSQTRDHQGIIARMPEYPYADLANVMESVTKSDAFVLILDRIQDPFNFGSILRSAELFGVDAIIIPEREQVGVTSHVARSSAGAVNHLDICRVESLTETCRQLEETGLQIVSAAADGAISPVECNFSFPTALIIGNEGEGIDSALLERSSQNCAIPQTGKLNSLNAAVAAGILCYEVSRQRRQN